MTKNMIPTPTTNCSNICQNVTHQVDTMPLFRPVSYDIWAPNPGAPGAWPGLLHCCSLTQGHTHSAVCNEAVTAHQQQHRHIDYNISIITVRPPLHIPPQKNKLLLQFHNSTSPTKNKHNILDNSHNLSIKQIKTSTSHNAVPWLEDLVFKLIQIDSNHYLVILIRPR